jgi:hypothetical protein
MIRGDRPAAGNQQVEATAAMLEAGSRFALYQIDGWEMLPKERQHEILAGLFRVMAAAQGDGA